jgi:hypothetical protein
MASAACAASVRIPASAALFLGARSAHYGCHLNWAFARDPSLAPSSEKKQWSTKQTSDQFRRDSFGPLTALANQRPPPSSNQLRWPPNDVVQSTPYGVCLTSFLGSASFAAICTGSAVLLRKQSVMTNRIIFGMYSKERYADCKHRV